MTILREKMIDIMTVKSLSPATQQSYLYAMTCLAAHYHLSPDKLDQDDLQRYLIYLVKEKKRAANSCRLQLQGIRFFYRNVLKRPAIDLAVFAPKLPLRIPELLTQSEVLRIVNAPENLKHRTELKLCYSCGLRISELVNLRVNGIDGERCRIKVEQGKGAKDRFVPLSEEMLDQLRVYWRMFKPTDKLFCGYTPDRSVSRSSVSKLFMRTKLQVGIKKQGGIHSLRHAFATHQLEGGLPLHLLQRWLGHNNIHTTMRYIHWVPNYQNGQRHFVNLLSREIDHELS